MQDFSIQVKISGGMPVEEDGPGFSNCINLKPFAKGLKAVLAPRPILPLADVKWPFPQFFRLVDTSYVCTQDTIYRQDAKCLTPLLSGIPNAGYPWSAAAVGTYRVFINNKVVVVGVDTLAVDTSKKIPTGIAIANIDGQLVIGAPWMYGRWHNDCVAWGRIGTTDFTISRDNISALRYAACGTVYGIKFFTRKTLSGLHAGFIAFGDEGITTWLTAPHPAMFNQVRAYANGVHSQLAIAGDIHHQFCLLRDKQLCEITDGIVTEKGYAHLMHNIDGEIVLSYNPLTKDLYIGY
jgi:hypothetical protein